VSCKQLWLGLFNFETDYEPSAKGTIGAFSKDDLAFHQAFYQEFHQTISMHTQEIGERSQTISPSHVPSSGAKPCSLLLYKSMFPPPLQIHVPSSTNLSTLASSPLPSSYLPLPPSPPSPPSTLCANDHALASSRAPLPPSPPSHVLLSISCTKSVILCIEVCDCGGECEKLYARSKFVLLCIVVCDFGGECEQLCVRV
jgi:hypothetical protein